MGIMSKLKGLISDDQYVTEVLDVMAPLSGTTVTLEDVPDVIFSGKIVGDGIAILPHRDNMLVAPIDGIIGKIFETNHAFSIKSDSGVELFVHFGINTVDLKGRGFRRMAENGQRVHAGDPIIEFDLALLEKIAVSTLTPVIVSETENIIELIPFFGEVTAGETIVFRIKR
ncbi:PTS glucose transporter subunit IIA [Klebsiella michiganensis]|uniref:PTS glucose transporter subunit IIA n=1 Tax=Enterobacteriaceae TaxID=543 RepID=UPI000F82B1F8|nr:MULTISPECIES: PTS glucose transporter subunit IIA [Enterobacteriaceae]MCZ9547068.1 PTS glucose transporter subunit IIA [Klebsiella pneumoniae]MEB7681448.1 PTS glucose transporter subunit IIA [Klebsiella michiganensis]QFQ82644.1 PTS glucose transporter subunit IIA [Enterobacter roggenkampii]HBQ2180959.1 PTS glucose transporter subunit IIA [Klebsiella pneumoniae]HCI6399742.1 PTS glucose transporter subunit IIA [Klebsiella pneumoniae]